MENMKKLIKILLTLILIIIIMIIMIKMSTKNSQNKEAKQEVEEQKSLQKMVADNESNKIKNITTEAEYFNVKECIDNYKSCSNYLYYEKMYGSVPENQKENFEFRKNKILNIIPDFVKEELQVDTNNIYDKVGLPDKEIRIDNIYVSTQKVKATDGNIDKINVKAYIVNGVFIDRENLQKEQLNIIVLMDTRNDTYLIIPQKYIEQKNIKIGQDDELTLYEKDSIEANEYNKYEETFETEEEMSKEYLNRFRTNLTNDPQYIYNKFDKEYESKRFGSYENFTNYINKNKENLSKIKLTSYLVNRSEDNTEVEYVCKDQYENLYIFEQTSPLNFTLKLDTYTITTDKFKETYEKAENYKKVQMNIDKFFQRINRQDYDAAYNCLAQSYRNNYFTTEEEFEKYVKNNFYTYNKVSYEKYEQKGDKLYIFSIKLEDITGENAEKKDVKIIMQLNDDLDFEMSFGM